MMSYHRQRLCKRPRPTRSTDSEPPNPHGHFRPGDKREITENDTFDILGYSCPSRSKWQALSVIFSVQVYEFERAGASEHQLIARRPVPSRGESAGTEIRSDDIPGGVSFRQ